MKFHLKSGLKRTIRPGQYVPILIIFLVLGCSSFKARNNTYESPKQDLLEEVSLKPDREHLKEYRSDVPQTIKEENDELSYILSLFPKDLSRNPKNIRSQFNRRLRSRQTKFRRKEKQERESFNREEKKQRKAFLAKLKKDRSNFMNTKPQREMIQEFSRQQKEQRTDFFEASKERRKDFNATTREHRKESNDYFRRMRREFQAEFQIYNKSWHEKKREMKKRKKTSYGLQKVAPTKNNQPKATNSEAEFDEIKNIPTTPLESE